MEWPRAQVRAPSFGACHRIVHHKNNILCICNTFISLKLAELMLVEDSSLETEKRKIRSDSGIRGRLPLKLELLNTKTLRPTCINSKWRYIGPCTILS